MKASLRCGVALAFGSALALVPSCTTADAGFSEAGTAGEAQAGQGGGGAVAGAHAGSAGAGTTVGGSGGDSVDGGAAGEPSIGGAGGEPSGGAGGKGGAGAGGKGGAGAGGTSGAGAGGGGMGGSLAGAPNMPGCGNHVLESGEQCDDGNLTNLDACDSACQFEQSQRVNSFTLQFGTDAFCTENAFGSAFVQNAAQMSFQTGLAQRVHDGSLSLLFTWGGLADPTGSTDSSVTLGWIVGSSTPIANYDGTSDLDWWHVAPPDTLNANRKPVTKLTGALASGVLTTAPGKVKLPLLSNLPLDLSSTKLKLSVSAASKPLVSAGSSPGHLVSEHLDPALTSFTSTGTQAIASQLCGNLSAASLKNELLPADYLENGATPCIQKYKANSTYLDVLVGGCTLFTNNVFVFVSVATQPDQVDAGLPQAAGGGPYKLSANGNHVVTGCKDKNGTTVALAACLNAAAYSSAYKLTTNRVIVK